MNRPLFSAVMISSIACLWVGAPGAEAQDSAAAGGKPVVKAASQDLDDQLLDQLDRDLLEGLDDLPLNPPAETRPGKRAAGGDQAERDADAQLLRQLQEGEDVELGPRANPLLRIGRRMRQVEELIVQRDTSSKTQQMQEQIVVELARLIEQLQEQCAAANRSEGQSRAGGGQPGREGSQGATQPGNQPARESTQRVGTSQESHVDGESEEDLVKRTWGHLPAHVRKQMQSASVEQFLPKYRELIEQYYKRLAEDRGFGP